MISQELESYLEKLQATLSVASNSYAADAVISCLREKITDNLKSANDEGYQDGWEARWQEEQQGRRIDA